MEDARKHIDTAFTALSRIPVTGDAVDMMALARQELRKAYAALTPTNKEVMNNDG